MNIYTGIRSFLSFSRQEQLDRIVAIRMSRRTLKTRATSSKAKPVRKPIVLSAKALSPEQAAALLAALEGTPLKEENKG